MVGGSFPDWHRDSDQFEQVMGYYWVTTAQEYLQHLGFGSSLPPVNQRQIELRINQFGGDNSFFRDDKGNLITLGKGGVDDAEDAEVIVHEYGHSVQDAQVTGFGTGLESGAIGEAFSDYLAVVGHELEGRRADAHARSVRGGLGLGVLHVDHAALPASPRRRQALSRGHRGRGARRR